MNNNKIKQLLTAKRNQEKIRGKTTFNVASTPGRKVSIHTLRSLKLAMNK